MRFSLALLLMSSTACVPQSVKEAQTAAAAQISLMQTRQAVLEKALQESEQRLEQVQGSLRVIGRDKGDVLAALDKANDQNRALRGEIETLQFQLDDLQRQVNETSLQQESRQLWDEDRLKQIEGALGMSPPPKSSIAEEPQTETGEDAGEKPATPESAEAEVKENAPTLPPTASGKLDRAIEEMRAGRQGVARFILEKTLEQHSGSDVLPEVRYRIGETWFNEQKWGLAARAFQVVVDKHKASDWAGWSMLRQGESFESMGNPDGAKIFYEDVIAGYPSSEAAAEAKEKLSKLR